ncbi:XdhC family protein [Miniphocaeibacter halophilus]|uniref:XdhC family protein n=1 Tax=Miniphocaeibacter halophilus TaxID=2931922 RepID=A0AC61MQQ6_9FIRM|nr:XdhC/CoxI family protein [Miniphocaeibacter halophilus]QQK07962.1 XdhC family protein [Miniphocaeibacter halophilus]
METQVLTKIAKKVEKGEKAALVILENNCGSVPGKEGSLMGVFEDGSIVGTVGGGAIEFDIVQRTLKAMERNKNFKFDYSLTEDGELQMACGGQTSGFVKIFVPKNNLIIFGAGHCAQKLAKFALGCNFNVTIVDDREEFKNHPDFEGITEYIVGIPEDIVDKLKFDKNSTYIVIATRGHMHDYEATKAVIEKDYKYIGMLGSRKKAIELKEKLVNSGTDLDLVNKIYLPIGLDISNGSIEEIGISILGEILKVKNGLDGKSRKIEIENRD